MRLLSIIYKGGETVFIIQKPESSNKTIRMPDELIEQLEEIASSENISFNQLVVQCCIYAINNLPRSNSMKITDTESFLKRKKQYKTAFMAFQSERSKASPQSLSQTFTDAIFACQPRNAELNIDFYELLTGRISIDNYEAALEQYFIKTNKKSPAALAKSYAYSFGVVRDFFKQSEYI